MKIAIGTDHRGVDIKNEIIDHFKDKYEMIDCCYDSHDGDDYPDYAFRVCEKIQKKEADFGILICGTGIGMSIAANKAKGIRCALVHNDNEASLARMHNDANIIAFGSYNKIEDMFKWVDIFINEDTSKREERHIRRVNKIIKYEE